MRVPWTAYLMLLGAIVFSPVVAQEVAVRTAEQRQADVAAAAAKKETALRAAVARGDAAAMYDLYVLLRARNSTPINSPELKSLLMKAAEGGHWRAMEALSEEFLYGGVVGKDPKQAEAWKQKADAALAKNADSGDTAAMIALGQRLRAADNYAGAAGWYRKAADAGDAKGMYDLAMLTLASGAKFGVKPADGYVWLDKSAKAGNITAMMHLAVRAERAKPPRSDEAIAWYAKAADAGSADAMRELGRIYWDGVLTAADAKKAIAWYTKAAVRDGRGLASIGDIYASGKIVPRDETAAVRWYRKAADAGEAEGMYDLASSLMAGAGVAKDPAEAKRWLVRAADAGSDDANHVLLNLGIEREPHAMGMNLPEITFQGVGFADTVQFLSDVTGANLHVDWPALDSAGIKHDAPVDLHLRNVPLREALAKAVAAVGQGKIAVGLVGGEVIISTPAATKSLAAMRARHRINVLPPEFLAKMQRRLPEVKFDGVGLSDALDFLRDVSGVKIELPADVLKAAKLTPDVPITIRSRNISFNIVLEQILHAAGGDPPLDYNEHDGRITITTAPPAEVK